MEDKNRDTITKMQEEANKMMDLANSFASMASSALDDVVKDAPESEKEKFQKQVDKVKKEGLGSLDKELEALKYQLNNIQ